MSVLPCLTFLLTLQESSFLIDLFCSLDAEAQNPDFLELEPKESQELDYNFRNFYETELAILESLTGNFNNSKNPKPKILKKESKNFNLTNFKNFFPKNKTKISSKIKNLNLNKNLEITHFYWQYQSVLNSLAELKNLETQKKNEQKEQKTEFNLFFGQNLDNLVANFREYILQILAKINQKSNFDWDNTKLQNLTLTNLSTSQAVLETENLEVWQVIFCPTELAGDLALFTQNKNNFQQNFQEKIKEGLENSENGKDSKNSESGKNEENQTQNNLDLGIETESNEFKNGKILKNKNSQNSNEGLSLFQKDVLLDLDELSILLRQQKFELIKKLQNLDFKIGKSEKNETENYNYQNKSKPKPKIVNSRANSRSSLQNNFNLTNLQKQFFLETLARVQIEQKINFYRFQVHQNFKANYQKSQIILSESQNSQILEKPPELSFLIVSLPENQAQTFFKLINPYKVAFAEIIPPQSIIFWQIKPKVITKFLTNFSLFSPQTFQEDPSFIFWRFLILNTTLAISDFGSGIYLLILAVFVSFFRKSWAYNWANFLFQVSFGSIFLGVLFGSFWTNFWQKSGFSANSILKFFGNFQIISFWDFGSQSFFNQILQINSPVKLVFGGFLFFGILGITQLFWSFFYAKKLNLKFELAERNGKKRKFGINLINKNSLKIGLAFGLYLILGIIFLAQIWLNFWLHEKISSSLFWLILQPLIFILTFCSAFTVSLLISQHFLLPKIYKPTATKLNPIRQNIDFELEN